MPRLLLLLVLSGSVPLVAQGDLSPLLSAQVKAHVYRTKAHTLEGRELQRAIQQFQQDEQEIAKERAALESQLRDELKPAEGSIWNWDTQRFEVKPH